MTGVGVELLETESDIPTGVPAMTGVGVCSTVSLASLRTGTSLELSPWYPLELDLFLGTG